MSGAIFAVLGAFSFALNAITMRRAVITIDNAAIGVFITVPLALPLFFLILLGIGKTRELFAFPWQGYVFLAIAGILHFFLGRALGYKSTQLLGSNVRGILTKLAPVIAAVLGFVLFDEPFTWKIALGIGLLMAGLVTIGWGGAKSKKGIPGSNRPGLPVKGVLYGLGTGVFWGISPVFVKLGLGASGDPAAGMLISYAGATLGMAPFMLGQGIRKDLARMSRKTFLWFVVTTVLVGLAQLFKYVALSVAPISIVVPLFSIDPVFVVMLSFVFNRRLELFTWQVIVGAITTGIGATLMA